MAASGSFSCSFVGNLAPGTNFLTLYVLNQTRSSGGFIIDAATMTSRRSTANNPTLPVTSNIIASPAPILQAQQNLDLANVVYSEPPIVNGTVVVAPGQLAQVFPAALLIPAPVGCFAETEISVNLLSNLANETLYASVILYYNFFPIHLTDQLSWFVGNGGNASPFLRTLIDYESTGAT